MGWDWNGYLVKQADVLYLAVEGGRGFINRVHALQKHYGLKEKDVPFYLYPQHISFSNIKDPDLVIEAVKERKISFVIIDTLSQAMEGDENNKDMGTFIRNMKRVQEATGAHVMAIHHTGKDATRGERGGYILRANVETTIKVSGDKNPRTAKILKQKDGEAGIEFYFNLEQVFLGLDEDGDEITSCVVSETTAKAKNNSKLSDRQKNALDQLYEVLLSQGEHRVPINGMKQVNTVKCDVWREQLRTRGVIDPEDKNHRGVWRDIKNGLMRKSRIAIADPYVWAVQDKACEP